MKINLHGFAQFTCSQWNKRSSKLRAASLKSSCCSIRAWVLFSWGKIDSEGTFFVLFIEYSIQLHSFTLNYLLPIDDRAKDGAREFLAMALRL